MATACPMVLRSSSTRAIRSTQIPTATRWAMAKRSHTIGTSPSTDAHTDSDGLADGVEVASGTNPTSSDSDGDGLSDGPEVATHGTNPLLSDTDGGGVPDGAEVPQRRQLTCLIPPMTAERPPTAMPTAG